MLPCNILINVLRANVRKACTRNLRKNPGINKRIKMLSSPVDRLDEVDAVDLDLDELESDFMSVHRTHKEHVRQMDTMREQEKFYIVRNKYFKEKYPNFLTWHDKEQIRYLYRKDPDEWTVEKLSEGFPALPDVIAKIIKSHWKKDNQTKVSNHDRRVKENWDMFKQGKIDDLPPELTEHLKKFTNRSLIFTPYKAPDEKDVVVVKPKPTHTEFSDIISDYEKLRIKTTSETHAFQHDPDSNLETKHRSEAKLNNLGKKHSRFESKQNSFETRANGFETKQHKHSNYSENNIQNHEERDTYYERSSHQVSNRNLTLESLRIKVGKQVQTGKSISADDQLLLNQFVDKKHETQPESKAIQLRPEDFKEVTTKKFNQEQNNYVQLKRTDYSHLIYPEKITIPAKLKKRGYTYKLNDCYYDYDGKFLYRVPGMVQ